jgi:hypothetical protein
VEKTMSGLLQTDQTSLIASLLPIVFIVGISFLGMLVGVYLLITYKKSSPPPVQYRASSKPFFKNSWVMKWLTGKRSKDGLKSFDSENMEIRALVQKVEDAEKRFQIEKDMHSEAAKTIKSLEHEVHEHSEDNNTVQKELEQKNQDLSERIMLVEKQLADMVKEVQSLYGEHSEEKGIQQLHSQLDTIIITSPVAKTHNNNAPEKLLISEQTEEIGRLKDIVLYYKEKFGE